MNKEIVVGTHIRIPKIGKNVYGVVTEVNGSIAQCEFWIPGSKGKSFDKMNIGDLEVVNLNEILNPK